LLFDLYRSDFGSTFAESGDMVIGHAAVTDYADLDFRHRLIPRP
jgi:hypothetical protein